MRSYGVVTGDSRAGTLRAPIRTDVYPTLSIRDVSNQVDMSAKVAQRRGNAINVTLLWVMGPKIWIQGTYFRRNALGVSPCVSKVRAIACMTCMTAITEIVEKTRPLQE